MDNIDNSVISFVFTRSGILGTVGDNEGVRRATDIEVQDPSNRMNVPIYTGTARNAWKYLIPGVYDATTHLDTFGTTCYIKVHVYSNYSFVTDVDGIALSGTIND